MSREESQTALAESTLHRWAVERGLPPFLASFAQTAAMLSARASELLPAIVRPGPEFDSIDRPPTDVWLGWYRNHRAIRRIGQDEVARTFGLSSGDELQFLFELGNALRKDVRGVREEMNAALSRMIQDERLNRVVRIGNRIAKRAYDQNSTALLPFVRSDGFEIRDEAPALLRSNPGMHFYVFVALPWIVLYGEYPSTMLRRARGGDEEAISALVRIDPTILDDPRIRGWLTNARRDVQQVRSQSLLAVGSDDVLDQVPRGRRHRKNEDETCTLVPSEERRVLAVRKLFADFAAGRPARVIRDELSASGLRTVTGSAFTVATLRPMLANSAYVGRLFYNRRTESKWHRYTNGQSEERIDEGLENRSSEDWVTTGGAWPALVDPYIFDAVQRRLAESREKQRHVRGRAIKGNYLLSGLAFCGVCGGRLSGQTCTSGKGYRTRYYICGAYNSGKRDQCPKRYTVAAEAVERHILGLIEADLQGLRGDPRLEEVLRRELRKANGEQAAKQESLQRRLAELDQQIANLRGHLRVLDPATAGATGLHDDLRLASEERSGVELELSRLARELPDVPSTSELQTRIGTAFDQLESVIQDGTLEERRELVAKYVDRVDADPEEQSVRISLYPPLFIQEIAGAAYGQLETLARV